MNYDEFIKSKRHKYLSCGKSIDKDCINDALFDFQKDITQWAIKKGRCALFLDTGLGKTHCQTEWARLVSDKRSLIIAPLSVAKQTVKLSKKITGTDVYYTRSGNDLADSINITNYEMIEAFNPDDFDAIVLDESSILKSIDGKIKRKLIKMFADTPYKLCCTATPAPNDETEIGNHAEFLGVMKTNEMLATYFIHANKVIEQHVKTASGKYEIVKLKQSNKKGQEWRLRYYGVERFYEWLSSWAMALRHPNDLGYNSKGYDLPELIIKPEFVNIDYIPDGQLFFMGLKGIEDRAKVRRDTIDKKIEMVSNLVNKSDEQWIIWCGLNQESDRLEKEINNSINVSGNDSAEEKVEGIEGFQDRKYKVLITKPKVAGFGMNFQNSHNMIFFGLSDSWESYYQCIRREWRFGQKSPVKVYIILTSVEREIYDNVMNKEKTATRMIGEMIARIKTYEEMELKGEDIKMSELKTSIIEGAKFKAYRGDSCQILKEIQDKSIDISVYSPPFADLYTYSDSEYDLGNSRDWNEFFEHYRYLINDILRVTKPGRISCVHTSDIAAMAMKDGYIGLKDFPGAVIREHEKAGWIYHGYAIVSKNPQAQAIRTKSKALLFVSLKKDSSSSRPAILDRVLFFKKPGDTEKPITPVENGEMDNEKWIDWAGGIWTGISESDTLKYYNARDVNDEKHICPLQLGTIDRCIKLYSNPSETLLTPFMGIGSEAYRAIKLGRRAIGIELKETYFKIAVENLKYIESQCDEYNLFNYKE